MNQNRLLAQIGRLVAFGTAGIVFYFAIVTPLDLQSQIIYGVAAISAAFLISRSTARQLTIALAILSLIMSTRYIYWRTTESLHFGSISGAFFGIGLYMAEIYAWLVLVFGYFQTMWPLERPVRPLTGSPEYWPTVDVYVPTYNESLTLVSSTVLAAMKMDYPKDRFRVHILDDGRREEFREFAEAAGVNYIIRPDNKHAKAGNLNHAMLVTDADLICIFDCDHVPTRAFLQLTVGWFLEDEKLALLQTPHYFYSPDPFQRNLETGDDLPGEGELFYSSVQCGNDLWNATFFCGSCAVIRRKALEENEGFAVETVTEDAHTALEMQKRGWNTAYLNIRLSAGLATERLALHIGQRIRWARGMTQILRLDNPLWGGKLTIPQRLCYLNAMLHFQFALPRVVFITSPLAYLLFGQNIIAATAIMILAYAGPHLVLAAIANARIQGKFRPTFWGEVYEAVLAFYLVWPTLVTLFAPKRGKFNVTDKGGLLTEDYFDAHLMRPHLIAAALLVAGIIFGMSKLIWPDTFEISFDTLLLNVGWAIFNLLILLTAIAVARETKQVRMQVRIRAELPATLYFADGHTVNAMTQNLSMGGASVTVPDSFLLTGRELTDIALPSGGKTGVYPVEVISGNNQQLRVKFREMSLETRSDLVRTVMGRADAWMTGDEMELEPEPILESFTDLLRSSSNLFKFTMGKGKMKPSPVEDFDSKAGQLSLWTRFKIMRSRLLPGRIAGPVRSILIFGVILGGLSIAAGRVFAADFDPAAAFSGGPSGGTPPATASDPISGGAPVMQGGVPSSAPAMGIPGTPVTSGMPSAGIPSSGLPSSGMPSAGQPALPSGVGVSGSSLSGGPVANDGTTLDTRQLSPEVVGVGPGNGGDGGRGGEPKPTFSVMTSSSVGTILPSTTRVSQDPSVPLEATHQEVITFEDMGALNPITLVGVSGEAGLPFTLRRDEVATAAKLVLDFGYSPALIPELSHLAIQLNGELIGSIQLVKERSGGVRVEIPINPALILTENSLNLRFIGHYTWRCEDPLHSTLWAKISNVQSRIELTMQRLPLTDDLALLPVPFFDKGDMHSLSLPFVFAGSPSNDTLQAGASVASYFGMRSSYRGFDFPVLYGNIPPRNAVVFATAADQIPGLALPPITGPTVAMVTNPFNAWGKLLLVLGRNASELKAAAYTIAAGSTTLTGPVQSVGNPSFDPRVPYDAVRWLRTDKPVRFGDIAPPLTLQGIGLPPGPLTLNYRAAPDTFVWPDNGVPVNLRYRFPNGEWLDRHISRLDISLNGKYLQSVPLREEKTVDEVRNLISADYVLNSVDMKLPPYLMVGQNQMQFYYDLRVNKRGECQSEVPGNVRTAIDPDSTIDLSGTRHFTQLPNLAYFANAGFPFTRMADLSQTAVLLQQQPTPEEISAFLGLMGRMGDATGVPVTGVGIWRGGDINQLADRDILAIGSLQMLNQYGNLLDGGPFNIQEGRLRVGVNSIIDRIFSMFGTKVSDHEGPMQADRVLVQANEFTGILSFRSPVSSDRVIVGVLSNEVARLPKLVKDLEDPKKSAVVQGDLAIDDATDISSYRVGPVFWEGDLPWFTQLRWYLSQNPLLLFVALLITAVLLATPIYLALRTLARLRLQRRNREEPHG